MSERKKKKIIRKNNCKKAKKFLTRLCTGTIDSKRFYDLVKDWLDSYLIVDLANIVADYLWQNLNSMLDDIYHHDYLWILDISEATEKKYGWLLSMYVTVNMFEVCKFIHLYSKEQRALLSTGYKITATSDFQRYIIQKVN